MGGRAPCLTCSIGRGRPDRCPKNPDDIKQIQPLDDEIDEEWERGTTEPDIRGIGVHKMDEWWHVFVNAMEFVREDPLESELRAKIASALSAVAGVTEVFEEDREVWIVSGSPSGRSLIQSVADVVDGLADRIRDHYRNLT